jgi:hypothetical protein
VAIDTGLYILGDTGIEGTVCAVHQINPP